MNLCTDLKTCLGETGLDAVYADQMLSDHLQTCSHCQSLLQAYAALPELLDALPEYEPDKQLLELTENAIQSGAEKVVGSGPRWRPVAPALAASLVALCTIGIYSQLGRYREAPPSAPVDLTRESTIPEPALKPIDGPSETTRIVAALSQQTESEREFGFSMAASDRPEEQPELERIEVTGSRINRADIESASPVFVVRSEASLPAPPSESEEMLEFSDDPVDKERQEEALEIRRRVSDRRASLRAQAAQGGDNLVQEGKAQQTGSDALATVSIADDSALVDNISRPTSGAMADAQHRAAGSDSDYFRRGRSEAFEADELTTLDAWSENKKDGNIGQSFTKQKPAPGKEVADGFVPGSRGVDLNLAGLGEVLIDSDQLAFASPAPLDFFQQYASTDGLVFQQPRGYWANTYVPGDPEIRLLSARLATWDRSGLGVDGQLEQAITPLSQPFDAPTDNALALSLMADANAIDGPTRMRLQVGVQGIAERLGHRPSMNVGIVVDLPDDATDHDRIAVRVLLDAVLKSRQAGDQFSLVFSGGPDELAVGPDEFRFGPLQVAKERVLEQRPELAGEGIKLARALEIAATAVRQNDDPSQPLGSSSILLISAGDLS